MERFSTILKRARQARGLTLDQVAQRTRFAKAYLSGIENSHVNPPSAKLVLKLAKLYELDPTMLLLHSVIEKAPQFVRSELQRRVFGQSQQPQTENQPQRATPRPLIESEADEEHERKGPARRASVAELSDDTGDLDTVQDDRQSFRANPERAVNCLTAALMACQLLTEGLYGASRPGQRRTLQDLTSAVHEFAMSWRTRKLDGRRRKKFIALIRLRLGQVRGRLSPEKRRILGQVRALVNAIARSRQSG